MDDMANQLMTELNLDDTESNKSTIAELTKQAWAMVKTAVDSSAKDDDLQADPIFIRAVKAQATALFYDRTLANGTPTGVRMMITHLQGEVGPDGFKHDTQ